MNIKHFDIRIILLNTYHPGNIGSTIRAMKTMGLTELALVNPRSFPDPKAISLAAGAADLLETIIVYRSLQHAIADRTQVFATSARQAHSFNLPQSSVEDTAAWIKDHLNEKVAIVFGGERDGLSANEISLCQQLLYIPGNPDYSVLNISSAVQIVCYELFKALSNDVITAKQLPESSKISQNELNLFLQSTEQRLIERGYIRHTQKTDSMKKFRSLINRLEPTKEDISLLRGIHKALTRQPIKK